jgi:hypothetical protein
MVLGSMDKTKKYLDYQSFINRKNESATGDFKDGWLVIARLIGIGGLQRY